LFVGDATGKSNNDLQPLILASVNFDQLKADTIYLTTEVRA